MIVEEEMHATDFNDIEPMISKNPSEMIKNWLKMKLGVMMHLFSVVGR